MKLKNTTDKVKLISQRKPFQLKWTPILCLRKSKEKKMIAIGVSRIEEQLEIDKFLKGQIKMRILLRTLFTKAEQLLIKNNRDFFIDSEESSRKFKKSKNKVDDELMEKDLGPHWDKLLVDCGLP